MGTPVVTDKYRCSDPRCGTETTLPKAAAVLTPLPPVTCTCGAELVKGWVRPVWLPSLGRSQRLRLR